MAPTNSGNGARIAGYVAAAPGRSLPAEIEDAARLCLADWLGVAIGAGDEPAGRVVRETVSGWNSGGGSTVLYGGRGAAAPFAALANGTLAHCLDFDDTHIGAVTHTSAPVWAATLALGEETGADETAMLRAYVAGFETASRLGRGLGEVVTARGWHGTGVFGRLGAAAASAALLRLDADRTLSALGAAATQAGGLTASFGTMAKPFHAGKAAMDGVIAAQLAANGLVAATGLLEPGGGLDNALVQDGAAAITPSDFTGWEILNNSFKPYAACHLTHPAVDAARALAPGANELASLRAVRAEIGAARRPGHRAPQRRAANRARRQVRHQVLRRPRPARPHPLGRRFPRAVAARPGDPRHRRQGRGRRRPGDRLHRGAPRRRVRRRPHRGPRTSRSARVIPAMRWAGTTWKSSSRASSAPASAPAATRCSASSAPSGAAGYWPRSGGFWPGCSRPGADEAPSSAVRARGEDAAGRRRSAVRSARGGGRRRYRPGARR